MTLQCNHKIEGHTGNAKQELLSTPTTGITLFSSIPCEYAKWQEGAGFKWKERRKRENCSGKQIPEEGRWRRERTQQTETDPPNGS